MQSPLGGESGLQPSLGRLLFSLLLNYRFGSITSSYYRGIDAVLILFDVTYRKTFEHIEDWLQAIATHSPKHCITVLVGNKTDQPRRQVTTEEAEKYAKDNNVDYVEASNKDGVNVNEPFLLVTRKLLQSKGVLIAWWKCNQFE